MDLKNSRSNDKSLLGPGPLSLGDSRLSESGPLHLSQEEVSSKEKRLEEESTATLATGKILGVNLRQEDELVLKKMIEDEFKAYSDLAKKWEEVF